MMTRWHAGFGAALFAVGLAQAAPLPEGANALREAYQDWLVTCGPQEVAVRCVMAQAQADPKSRQRVLAIELQAQRPDRLSGTLLMPFGLALAKGVTLKVGDGAAGPVSGFSTCMPQGCLVPLEFDATMVAQIKAGKVLNIGATANDTGHPVTFTVSLNGFPAALARMLKLGK